MSGGLPERIDLLANPLHPLLSKTGPALTALLAALTVVTLTPCGL